MEPKAHACPSFVFPPPQRRKGGFLSVFFFFFVALLVVAFFFSLFFAFFASCALPLFVLVCPAGQTATQQGNHEQTTQKKNTQTKTQKATPTNTTQPRLACLCTYSAPPFFFFFVWCPFGVVVVCLLCFAHPVACSFASSSSMASLTILTNHHNHNLTETFSSSSTKNQKNNPPPFSLSPSILLFCSSHPGSRAAPPFPLLSPPPTFCLLPHTTIHTPGRTNSPSKCSGQWPSSLVHCVPHPCRHQVSCKHQPHHHRLLLLLGVCARSELLLLLCRQEESRTTTMNFDSTSNETQFPTQR